MFDDLFTQKGFIAMGAGVIAVGVAARFVPAIRDLAIDMMVSDDVTVTATEGDVTTVINGAVAP